MFQFYPKMLYQVDDYDYLKVTDISFYAKIKDFVSSFGNTNGRPYTVQNGEAPPLVSYKMYGTSRFDYSILMLNDIRNLYDEWPRSDSNMNEYLEEKYGSIANAKNSQYLFYRGDGIRLSKDSWLQLADSAKYFESYYDYEIRRNREKSRIKLLDYGSMLNFEVNLRQVTAKLISEEINRMK